MAAELSVVVVVDLPAAVRTSAGVMFFAFASVDNAVGVRLWMILMLLRPVLRTQIMLVMIIQSQPIALVTGMRLLWVFAPAAAAAIKY